MTRTPQAVVALTVAMAVACGGPVETSPEPEVAAVAPLSAPLSAPDLPPDPEVMAEQLVAEALAEVSRTRRLAVKGVVQSRVLSRARMAELVRDKIVKEVPAEVVAGQTALLVALGLVPVDFDLVESLIGLMSTELAGFYEPENRTMYLAEDLEGAERHATLAHELVHALQDQHYGLGERIRYRPDAGDAQTAVHALAEGDATSAMLDELLRDRDMSALDIPEATLSVQVRGAMELATPPVPVPGIIRRSVVAPYVDGVELVHALRRKGGWAAVDEVWRTPPESTEQVLHPEKLHRRDPPVSVALPPGPEGGAPLLYSDVFGEQGIRLVLEEWMPRATAVAAASDWGGDRLAVFRDAAGGSSVLWHVQWDAPGPARRGFEAFVRGALAGRTVTGDPKAVAVRAAAQGRFCVERGPAGAFGLRHRAKSVIVAIGPYARAGAGAESVACPAALKWAERALSAAVAQAAR